MSKAAIILAAMAAMDTNNQIGHYLDNPLGIKFREKREPKNKFNLTDEEIDQLSGMTPKEKKAFLKARK